MKLQWPGRPGKFVRAAALIVLSAAAANPDVCGLRASSPSDDEASASSAVIRTGRDAGIMRNAMILAGLQEEAQRAGGPLPGSEAWRDYCRLMDQAWAKWDARVLPKISAWADTELRVLEPDDQWVYYPFSGPDILYASVLFPRADAYILTGLEQVGESVWREGFDDPGFDGLLEALQLQLRNILGLSFFRREDLKVSQKSLGIGDIILVFLARAGFEILDASPVYIDKRSQVVPIYPGQTGKIDPRLVRGIRLDFRRPSEADSKTLFYFRADLSDSGMIKNPEYLDWLKKKSRPATFLKAASYLLQYKRFSKIRSYILDRSSAVLQDDSGLAFQALAPARWTVTLYGNYVGPVDKFKDFYQDDLKAAYAAGSPKSLPFSAGYRFRPNESCLILATSKAGAEPPPAPALLKVALGGTASHDAIVTGGSPEIEISFSRPVDPDTILLYLRRSGAATSVALDLRWDRGFQRAIGVPVVPLTLPGTYQVILCGGARGTNDQAVVTPETWPFRVLGMSAGDFEDKTIIIDRENQRVFLCGKAGLVYKSFPCATGSFYPTAGVHRILDKYLRAKSLFDDSTFSHFVVFQKAQVGANVGFHSIPIYPDGRLAGLLGQPNSHGCVRLSGDAAGELYEWAPLGTKVVVY
ncbi:MAG: L,D-transpeptidase [Candidatus Aminicenantales bacterium]